MSKQKAAGIRAHQAEETQQKIRDTMLSLLREKDFDDINVQEISERAQISAGLIYHYYKNKIELAQDLHYVLDEYYGSTEMKVALDEGTTACEKIEKYFQRFFSFPKTEQFKDPATIKLMEILFWHPRPGMFDTVSGRFELLGNVVEDGLRSGELVCDGGKDEICSFLFTIARGITYRWYVQNKSFDGEDVCVRFIRLALNLFKAK